MRPWARWTTADAEATTPTAYFDGSVREYAAAYAARSPAGQALRARQQRVLELLDRPVGRALDVGCGPGFLAQELLRLGGDVWGVDAAPRMIEECQRRLGGDGRAWFEVGDATRLTFPASSFDTVVCLGVIDHVPAYEGAIRELVRVLRAEGTLVVSFPNLLSPYAVWKRFVWYPAASLLRPAYCALTRRVPVTAPSHKRTLHTARAATAMLAGHGAEVTAIVYYHFNIFLSPLDEWFPAWTLAATRQMERLRYGALRWLGAGFVVKARKVR